MKNARLFYFYSLSFSKASVEFNSIDLGKRGLDFQFVNTMVGPFNCCVNTNWHQLDYISLSLALKQRKLLIMIVALNLAPSVPD